MDEIVKSRETETIAVISQTQDGRYYVSLSGKGNGYGDYADTIEEARKIALDLIADWDDWNSFEDFEDE